MFKRLLRRRLRRESIDAAIVDLMSEWGAFVHLLWPGSIRTYATPEVVEKVLAETPYSTPRKKAE